MRTGLRLEPVTQDNVRAACKLQLRADQDHLVAPVAWSLADAYTMPDIAWPHHRWTHPASPAISRSYVSSSPIGRLSPGGRSRDRAGRSLPAGTQVGRDGLGVDCCGPRRGDQAGDWRPL